MAMNNIGLNLLLQASPQQVQDLLLGLQPGAVLRGRIVDILPQGKAVIQLQGQNLLAQLPPAAAGQVFQKGDVLSLEVGQQAPSPQNTSTAQGQATASNAGSQAKPVSGPTQALTFRLVATNLNTAPATAPAQAPTAQGSPARTSLPPQAAIEQALIAAKVPVSSATLGAAKILAAHGLPLDAQTLQSVVQIAESLLAAEQSSAGPAPLPSDPANAAPALPLPARAILQEALPALRLAVQNTPAAAPRLALQQALTFVEAVLNGTLALAPTEATVSSAPGEATLIETPSPLAQLPGADPSLVPELPQSTVPQTLATQAAAPQKAAFQSTGPQTSALQTSAPQSVAPQSVAPQSVAPQSVTPQSVTPQAVAPQSVTPQAPALALQTALQALLDAPSPAALQALQVAVVAAAASSPGPALNPTIQARVANLTPTVYAPVPAALPARREAAVLLIQSFPPEAPGRLPLTPKVVSQAARALAQALEEPQSPPAQTLIRSVQAQFPEAKPAQILRDAQDALQVVAEHFDALPANRPLPGPQGLAAELEAASLPLPQQSLNQMPRETVFEAVAWLKTRGLPPQRPLVEAAAQFLTRGQAALGLAEQVARTADSLPEGLMTWRPSLKQAFEALDHAIQRSTLKLDAPDLGSQLKQWPKVSGLDLERALFQALDQEQAPASADQAAGPPLAGKPAQAQPSLREALAQVQHEVKQALRDPAGMAPNVAPKLEQAASDAGRALQSLNALPLQAQPAPSFHTVTLPLALPLQGPLNSGQLSVTWRQGQERELNEKEPVNVAVALNTESLGEVRVLLQVWKGAVSASVKTQDKATADFLSSGAAELKQGFAERTPFRVRALDFAALPEGETLPDLGEADLLPQGAGVNLSA